MKEELEKIANAMYNANRHISLNYIALENKQTSETKQKLIFEMNRFIGEWIKKLREIIDTLEEAS